MRIMQLNFKACNSNDNTASQPMELAILLHDDTHHVYVTSSQLETNMYDIKDGN